MCITIIKKNLLVFSIAIVIVYVPFLCILWNILSLYIHLKHRQNKKIITCCFLYVFISGQFFLFVDLTSQK